MIPVVRYAVELTLIEPMLGTVPKHLPTHGEYVQAKGAEGVEFIESIQADLPPEIQADLGDRRAAWDAEMATAPDAGEEGKGETGFHSLPDGTLAIYDYMIRGFFKESCGMLRRTKGTLSAKVTAHKKTVDGLVFVTPRLIALELLSDTAASSLERPLRISGPTGERVALAKSDTVPAGTKLRFTLKIVGDAVPQELLEEWLEYGAFHGLGQWRNASWRSFTYTLERLG